MDTRTAQAGLADKNAAEIQKRKLGRWLVVACLLVYVGSFLTRMIYSVELVEIIADLGITKAQGGIPLTCYYVTYGIFQLLFAVFINRFNVRKFFTLSIGASAVVFMLGAVFSSLPALMILYAAIGVLQCCSWGGLLHLVTLYVHPDKQAFSVGILCTGGSISNLLAYLMSYVSLSVGSWKYAFFFGGVFLLLTAAFFFIITGRVEKQIPPNVHPAPAESSAAPAVEKAKHRYPASCILYLALCVVGCFITYALYTAGSNYMTMLLVDVHGMPSKYSVLISMLMPVFVTAGPFLLTAACKRKGTFILRSSYFLFVAAIMPLILVFCHDSSIFWTVILGALYSMIISGVTTGYISIAPLHMDDEMPAATFSSIANAGGTVAAAATPVVFGWMLDHLGWAQSYWILLAATVLVGVLHVVTVLLLQHPRHRVKKKNTHRYNHRKAHKQ